MIDVSVRISVPRATAWACFTEPKHIVNWNFAGDDWCCPSCSNDLRVGGTLNSRMEARDGSFGFDFESTYTAVDPGKHLALTMGDGRRWTVDFSDRGDGTCLVHNGKLRACRVQNRDASRIAIFSRAKRHL